ncbi:MAG: DUF2652 domain-containing protein [Chitinophagaceae bacterium]
MSEQAIILIPDISGFTYFTSTTEIDHSSHITNELLELIVSSNESGFTLGEIEGDAVLFYRKGDPLSREKLVDQCLKIFANFHTQLRIIERDSVCQCGACQSVTDLTLKFIIHYGFIKEIKVAQFIKATGIDMIVAHRLLKNNVDSHEYILLTEPCCKVAGLNDNHSLLSWSKSNYSYPAIGNIDYEFAVLTGFKNNMPPIPARPAFVINKGDDNLEVVINATVKKVYQTLINVDKRPDWLAGVDSINRDMTSERIGMQHNCVLMGMVLKNVAVYNDYTDDHALYVERVDVDEINLKMTVYYDIYPFDNGQTRLTVNINWMNSILPPDAKKGLTDAEITNLELFKAVCEHNPA